MHQVWFITGASRGIGRAIVEVALAAGHSVVATVRRPSLDAFADLLGIGCSSSRWMSRL